METALRRVVEKIIEPKFPEISGYNIDVKEMSLQNGGTTLGYNLFFSVNEELPFLRERELYNDTYTLFGMLGPVDARLKVFIIRDTVKE